VIPVHEAEEYRRVSFAWFTVMATSHHSPRQPLLRPRYSSGACGVQVTHPTCYRLQIIRQVNFIDCNSHKTAHSITSGKLSSMSRSLSGPDPGMCRLEHLPVCNIARDDIQISSASPCTAPIDEPTKDSLLFSVLEVARASLSM
jgi:hypothetical protein